MRKKEPQLILLNDFETIFTAISDEKAGQLVKALFYYNKTDILPEDSRIFSDPETRIPFQYMAEFIDRNKENYRNKCEANSKAAKKSHEKADDQSAEK